MSIEQFIYLRHNQVCCKRHINGHRSQSGVGSWKQNLQEKIETESRGACMLGGGGRKLQLSTMAMHVHKDKEQHTTLSGGGKAKPEVYRNPQNVQ